jgi:hypothetical protein
MAWTGTDSGPVMVWELCGKPRPDRPALRAAEPVEAVCAMCGTVATETIHVKHTIAGKSFTDQYLLAAPGSDRTCYGCAWACTGKGMDQVRMWTILARTDQPAGASNAKAAFASEHVQFTSRADMRQVAAALADPPEGPWLVSVAESGQKHTLPYTHVNSGGGAWTVRMDACDVTATPAQFRQVFSHALALRAAGFSAQQIETLTPAVAALTPDRLPTWRHHAAALAPWRSSPLLHLAVFLPNKEHMDDYLTTYPAAGPADTHRLGSEVPERDPGLGRRHTDRTEELVGPGTDRTGDRYGDGVLF